MLKYNFEERSKYFSIFRIVILNIEVKNKETKLEQYKKKVFWSIITIQNVLESQNTNSGTEKPNLKLLFELLNVKKIFFRLLNDEW